MSSFLPNIWPLVLCFLAFCSTAANTCRAEAQTSPATSVRIGFGSCIMKPQSPIWEQVAAQAPDVFLFLGDNIYMGKDEVGDAEKIKARYVELFATHGIVKLRKQVRTLAIWDDHDFGKNNSDSTNPGKEVSLKLFRHFWQPPAPPAGLENSIAHKAQIGPVKFLMTDNRSFRIKSNSGGTAQLFGKAQLEWLQKELSAKDAKALILASGGQILSTSKSTESFDSYPEEKAALIETMLKVEQPVFILSGDRHYLEVFELARGDRRIIEATSSPLSASHRPASEAGRQEQRKLMYLGTDNFGLLTLNLAQDNRSFRLEFFNERGRLLTSYQ